MSEPHTTEEQTVNAQVTIDDHRKDGIQSQVIFVEEGLNAAFMKSAKKVFAAALEAAGRVDR